ncbi:MAG: glutaredoxin 3 [Alphaproteobacteria bacterium]|nr:glutaredoxin 3 [Alphaproteobacteria bacterium]
MAKVEIYTTMFCPFCGRAKALLSKKGVAFTEYDVGGSSDARAIMRERAGGRYTVPQIFIDDQSIGGSDELAALDSAGKLDTMLVGGAPA